MNIKRNIIFALSLSAFMPQREKIFLGAGTGYMLSLS